MRDLGSTIPITNRIESIAIDAGCWKFVLECHIYITQCVGEPAGIGFAFYPGLSSKLTRGAISSSPTTDNLHQLIRLTADLLRCVQPGAYLARGKTMSFASSLAVPASSMLSNARALLRGGSLRSMVHAVGVVVGAGMLAAGYQIAYEEGRQIIGTLRNNAAARRARNDAVMLALISTERPLQAQDSIRRSRDALRTAMKLVTDEGTPENHRLIIRGALGRLVTNGSSS